MGKKRSIEQDDTNGPESLSPQKKFKNASPECGRLLIRSPDSKKIVALVIPIRHAPIIVGRHRSAHFVISDQKVSNHHFKLFTFVSDAGDPFCVLEDHSLHGTIVNGVKLKGRARILVHGDKIEVGCKDYHHKQDHGSALINFETSITSKYVLTDRVLGTGGNSSSVVLALSKTSSRQFACKILPQQLHSRFTDSSTHCLSSKTKQKKGVSLLREIQILKDVSHPNINRIGDVLWDEKRVYLFLDLVMGGDLFGYLVRRKSLVPTETKWIGFQLLQALSYLHDVKNISHRDLKLENVLLQTPVSYPRVLIADFGSARLSSPNLKSVTGTLINLPPEVLGREVLYDGKMVDCWGVGLILYLLLTGVHPFRYPVLSPSQISSNKSPARLLGLDPKSLDIDDLTIKHNVVSNEFKFFKNFGKEDSEIKNIISKFLVKDPKLRLSATAGLQHVWFSRNRKELEDLYVTKVSKPWEEHLKEDDLM